MTGFLRVGRIVAYSVISEPCSYSFCLSWTAFEYGIIDYG